MSTVFVVTDREVPGFAARLREEFPHATFHGAGPSLRAGVYSDQAPVRIDFVQDADVAAEAAEMAGELARAGAAAGVVAAVRAGTARFELAWDLARDPDPVPETADGLLAWAQALAGWSGGVALVDGRPLTAVDQLF